MILWSPFRPSLTSTLHTSLDQNGTPMAELLIPKLETESP